VSISLQGVSFSHAGGVEVLHDISLAVTTGERVAIIGPSGAGKTTLLRVLATALRPAAGTVSVLGAEPWTLGRAALRRLRANIGMVHQAPPLPPRSRVVTAVLAGRLGHWPWWKSLASLVYPADIDGARDALARMEIADKLFERCDSLSGGQLQRVAVARVLYQQPQLVLADEPVSAVDPALSDRVVAELNRDAQARNATLIASLHAVDLALHWFPRVIGVKNGGIAFDLPPVRIDDAMLKDLYAAENAVVPTQASQPLHLPPPGIRRKPLCS
jgi:phosphonate transport system ATP-binding protein